MKVILVGGEKIAYFAARAIAAQGHEVTIINRDRDECVRLSRLLKATVVYGDGTDPQVLEEAGGSGADVIVAVTPNDQDNLAICQIAKSMFNVPRILSVVNDPDNESVFYRLTDAVAFSITRILTRLIQQRVSYDEIVNLVPVAEGKVSIAEVLLDDSSPVIGKAVREIRMPERSLMTAVMRGEDVIIPRGSTVLQVNDRLVIMMLPQNQDEVLRLLTGNQK